MMVTPFVYAYHLQSRVNATVRTPGAGELAFGGATAVMLMPQLTTTQQAA